MKPDLPIWFLYEVDVEADNVLRMIEIFANGSSDRNSIEIEARYGPRHPTVVDGPFMQHAEIIGLEEIEAEAFEAAWREGRDKPYWNAPGNQFPPSS
ncbi:hypothetical protein [Rhizobium sp. LjRoot254]|uniref:hypothetical protein n=1 Tax=Rhizobium sp. LjRoot254 TaxID=3342297 RepID=UPI003ED0FDA4